MGCIGRIHSSAAKVRKSAYIPQPCYGHTAQEVCDELSSLKHGNTPHTAAHVYHELSKNVVFAALFLERVSEEGRQNTVSMRFMLGCPLFLQEQLHQQNH